MRQKKQAA